MNKHILIGISGKKFSGKTTVASLLQKEAYPLLSDHINFADSLKDEVCAALRITREYLEAHKDNFRLILQGYGTDFKRQLVSDNYWIEKYLRRCLQSTTPIIVTSDVRFENEYNTIVDAGGVVVRVERMVFISTDIHPSECQLDRKIFDYTIENDGTLEDLRAKVQALWKQIQTRQ